MIVYQVRCCLERHFSADCTFIIDIIRSRILIITLGIISRMVFRFVFRAGIGNIILSMRLDIITYRMIIFRWLDFLLLCLWKVGRTAKISPAPYIN